MQISDLARLNVSLDQLAAFVAVAEHRSFSKAARSLTKVQSAVSQNIKSLETTLGVRLFDRTTRRVALTEEGRVLLAEARAVSNGAVHFAALASQFGRGVEPRVRVAVDLIYPGAVFAGIARRFAQAFPGVVLEIAGGMLGSVIDDVHEGRVDLGLTGMPQLPPSLTARAAGHTPMVAVVAPSHPLAAYDGLVPGAELERHVQLVIADPGSLADDTTYHVLSARTWRLTDMPLRRELLIAGVGWGRVPISWVREDLQQARLVSFTPEVWEHRVPSIEMRVITRTLSPPGPAGLWLAKEMMKGGLAWEREVGKAGATGSCE